MEHDALLDTVRRLLALSENNPNEHEAASALAKAQELMLEHDLAHADLQVQEWAYDQVYAGKVIPLWCKVASAIAARYFGCFGITKSGRRNDTALTLFGRPHHVQIATHVYHYLARTLQDLARPLPRRDRNAFILGAAEAVHDKLQERLRASGAAVGALVANTHAEVKAELDKRMKLTKHKLPAINGSAGAFAEGYARGQEIEIHQAVGGAVERKRLSGH